MTRRDPPISLARNRLDDIEFLSEEGFSRITKATGLEIAEGVDLNAAHLALLSIIRRTISRQISRRITKLEQDELNRRAKALASFVSELRNFEPPPPAGLGHFLSDLGRWNKELKRSSVRGRRENLMVTEFMPETLGLFEAVFEKEPTASAKYGKNNELKYSPAALFVDAIMAEVTEFLDRSLIAEKETELRTLSATWKPRDPTNLEQWLTLGKSSGLALFERDGECAMYRFLSDSGRSAAVPSWRGYSSIYKRAIRSS